MVEPESVTKRCPRCEQDIKIEQLFCQYCGQQFAVRRLGYCTTCHLQVSVDSGTACPSCGNAVTDVIVESEALDAPPATGQPASLPLAQPSAGLAGGPGFQEPGVPIPAARTPNWRRRVLIAAAISLLASGLMIAASFMPWLESEGGRTFSGWDLYKFQSDVGNNVLVIPGFFTDPEGLPLPFFTGLATLISALCLAGVTIVFLALSSLLRRRKSLTPERPPLSARLVMALHALALVVAVSPPLVNAMFYVEGGEASGASLEYGLILLWAATYVGLLGSWLGVYSAWDRSKRPVLTYLGFAVAFAIAMIAASLLLRY